MSPDENTGRIQWEFSDASIGQFCWFALFNNTIDHCAWILCSVNTNMAGNYTFPLFTSDVFRVNMSQSTGDAVVHTNKADATMTATSIASTITTVTCPRSGIPAQTQPATRVELWPPLAETLSFPDLAQPTDACIQV